MTPAYDICPQPRGGNEASQAMLIDGNDRMSRLSSCLKAAHHYLLSQEQARQIIQRQIDAITTNWNAVCDEARLTKTDRNFLWGRQFMNPYCIEGAAS